MGACYSQLGGYSSTVYCIKNVRFEYWLASSPVNPPLTVIKMVHTTSIHFMQICYTAAFMLTKVV